MYKYVLNFFINFIFLIGYFFYFSIDVWIIFFINVFLWGFDEYIFEEIYFYIGKREEKGFEYLIDEDFYFMEV